MKKTIKLAVVAALALGATSAFATNGSALIGMGAKSRGMGGIGIGMSHGAESALSNPALITDVEGTEISFGGTIFMPNVKNSMGLENKSDSDLSVIPEVSIASKVTDNFYMGVGMWGTAGMGVDYRTDAANFNMVTNLQLMQFGVPLAYKMDGFSIGITPILQYGSLDIDYSGVLDVSNVFGPGATAAVGSNGGVSQDLKFGYNIGLAYEIADLTIGAVYKSEIEMEYTGQMSSASAPFAAFGMFNGQKLSDKLSTPAEIGIGASYKMGESTIAIDYKQIQWGSAEGYKDFKWEDQNVIAVGYEYATDGWAVRLGYNYASNPIQEQAAAVGPDATGSAINMFNLLGFPGTVESHYTLGGSFDITKTTSVDLAYTYAPEVTETYTTAGFLGFGAANPSSITTKHSQTSLSAQVNFKF